MKKLKQIVVFLALVMPTAQAHAQQNPTYYYCWAYESGGSRVWVSQVRYGDRDSYTDYVHAYQRGVSSNYNVRALSATSCGPYDENSDRSNVQAQRDDFISRERNESGKSVLLFN